MGRLVYHDQSGISGQSSPFDEAVLEVARSGSLGIVSPYIGVDYLQRIIQVSNEWRLISDVEAWLSSLPLRARPKAWLFIRENLENIHHCPAIHAKAVISQKLAMFGSANLTNTGILRRTEMGILIDDLVMVTELGAWFDALWQQTLPPIADETNAFVQWLDEEAVRTPARREKFSLSASSKKIRARLAELPPSTTTNQEGAPLNLGAIAQTLVLQEHRHYDTLEESIEAAINTLAKDKFTFYQIVSMVHEGFSSASIREIYFALLQHCANHVRSVFAENTRNRLILNDGVFIQSTRELITQALVSFDVFLVVLIRHYDFKQFRDMPDEESLALQTGLRGSDQVILTSELLDANFLDIDDVAGHLPRYKLSEDFEWDGRYKLFSGAMHDWDAKKNIPPLKNSSIQDDDEAVESDDDFIDERGHLGRFPDDYTVLESDDDGQPWGRDEATDIISAKAELARVQRERQEKIDKVLAHLLSRLFSGRKLQPNKSLVRQLSGELGVGEPLVKLIISGKGRDMPKVIVNAQNGISISPRLAWKDLKGYPLTQGVCKNFIRDN